MVFLSNYSWGNGAQYSTPAETVGKTLERIEERDGAITKEAFLEESRPAESPTHEMFEWDDRKAAEKYRLVQSGKIINNLVVDITVEGVSEEPTTAKAIVNVTEDRNKKAVYQSVVTAMESTDSRTIILNHALEELNAFKAKYSNLQELVGVFEAIREVETK